MAKGESSSFKNKKNIADRFTDTVFSWSLQDVFNESLFKDKVFLLLIRYVYLFTHTHTHTHKIKYLMLIYDRTNSTKPYQDKNKVSIYKWENMIALT